MSEVIIPNLSLANGRPVCLSTDVARHFEKRHKNVLRDIEALLAQLPPGHGLNFEPMSVEVEIGNGAFRRDRAYRITRDGFTLLAMGFTGPKALAFKLAYIQAFNELERRRAVPLSDWALAALRGFMRRYFLQPLTRHQNAEINRKAAALGREMTEWARKYLLHELAREAARAGHPEQVDDYDVCYLAHAATAADVAGFCWAQTHGEPERLEKLPAPRGGLTHTRGVSPFP